MGIVSRTHSTILVVTDGDGIEHRFAEEEVETRGGLAAILSDIKPPRSARYDHTLLPPADIVPITRRRPDWSNPNFVAVPNVRKHPRLSGWGFDPVLALAVAALVLVAVAVIGFAILGGITGDRCAKVGYPRATVTITLKRYCIKRVDQTDVVVPLSEVDP